MSMTHSSILRRAIAATLALTTLGPIALGQEKPPAKPAEPAKPQADQKKPKPGEPKPYEEVITKEAVSQDGLYKVHRIDDKVYFEIPASAYGKELLWQTEISEVPNGFTFIGTPVGTRVVTFTRRNNTVHLRNVDWYLRSEGDAATKLGVDANSFPSILMAFPVEAESKDKNAVIDVTRLFTSDPPEFAAKGALGGAGVDPSRTYIDRVKAFPTNIETRSVMTFPLGPRAGGFFGPEVSNPTGLNSVSAVVHYSLVRLPERPIMGRLSDSRVGYFETPFEAYGRAEHRAMQREYITRFRLEKKDPNAEISEAVKPITFYMAREVPMKWRKYVKAGVEDWQPAFEKAGFKNAIICLDAPSKEQDPDWDAEDARYSVIRWAPSTVENAMGPSIQDPRSGETISAHIIVWHNMLKLAENWFFTQASPSDVRAQRLPIAEDLLGELVRYIIAHEVGHTLGLQHNMKASSSYTAAQLRDPKFTSEFGVEASIMDYGRFNYVAQPQDKAHLIPKIGPYDHFAIEWGYKPIPAISPDGEKVDLDKIASRQVEDARLRFGRRGEDPTVQTEDLGSDPLESSRLGLLNIRRVAKLLLPATGKHGEDYRMTSEMFGELQYQRLLELSHVAKLIGGIVETDYHYGRGSEVFTPTPADRQAQAVTFLVKNGFRTPDELLDVDLLTRISPAGNLQLVIGVQESLLRSLLSETRVRRMYDIEALRPSVAYPVWKMVGTVQNGIWDELIQGTPTIEPYRRNLQRSYLRIVDSRINGAGATGTELKGVLKDSLRSLAKTIDKAIPRAGDRTTAIHLSESRAEIERMMKPAAMVNVTSGTTGTVLFGIETFSIYDLFGISARRSVCGIADHGPILEGVDLAAVPKTH